MRLTDLCRLLTVLLAFGAGAGSLNAARAETFTCEEDCLAAIYDWIVEDVKHYMPLQYAVHERFDGPESKASCSVTRDEKPAVHGVVLAPRYPRFAEYVSTQNDARLLRDFLLERGVRTDFLQVLMGPDVSRPAAIAALRKSLPCVRERDQVVLVMTGDAGNYGKLIAPALDDLGQTLCAGGAPQPVLKDYCRSYKKLPRQAADDISERYRRALTDHDEAIFFTSEVHFNAEQRRKDRNARIVGIGAFEISNYVAQVRNRGADAIVVIDASYSASFYLDNLQRRSTPDGSWFWNSYATPEPPDTMVEEFLVPLFGTGHFAAFYAAADNQIAGAVTDTERAEKLSYLVLAFTEVLREKPGAPLTVLAKDITKSMKRRGAGQDPIFAASSTGLRLLSTAAADAPPSDLIEIISPSLKRGASFVEEKASRSSAAIQVLRRRHAPLWTARSFRWMAMANSAATSPIRRASCRSPSVFCPRTSRHLRSRISN